MDVHTQPMARTPFYNDGTRDAAPIEKSQTVIRELRRASAKAGIRVETLTTIAPEPMEGIARVARLHRCESVLLGLSEISADGRGTHLESLLGTRDANVVVLRSRDDWRLADDEVREQCQVEVLQSDDPLETVAQRADESDLLILGVQRHGRRKKLFGGFTVQIAQRTSCPIIVMSRRG